MTTEELKAEIAVLRQLKAEQDMDDAIVLAALAGVLSVAPNFDWRDLEVQ